MSLSGRSCIHLRLFQYYFSKLKMLEYCFFRKSLVLKHVRYISQFKIQRTDCVPYGTPRKIKDPKLCGHKDKGLVLGVYYNENAKGEPAILTASAQKYDRESGGKLWKMLKLSPIPKLGESRIFFDLDPTFAFVAVSGLGSECLTYNVSEQLDENKEAIRIAAGVGAISLQPLNPKAIHLESFGNAEAAAEGAYLANWQFEEYKSTLGKKILPKSQIYLHDDCDIDGWHIGQMKAEAQNLARYLQEMPANMLNPTSFAKIAVELLCELDINVEVKTQGWAASHEMGGFVAIGKSSIQPPLYVEISYYGAGEKTRPIVLIGKGVTFDSGSLDLKSPKDLRYMKGDMAGAGCILAITRTAARLKLPINIRGILPLCELMPNGNSPKFGDVAYSANGKSLHIRLPSREGRLLIADSLVYARNYWPKLIIDIGTMSKELIYTLDGSACGCYTNSDELFCYLQSASSQTGDRIWRMPLWKFYEDRVRDCHTADVANTGRDEFGDSPNCAAFLKQFICDTKWVHLDTYNIAYSKGRDFPYLRRGMTGRPTRTILEFIFQLLADAKL
ncbi:cytosol aminopeptidase-like [Bombyx mandarina]|uniref:Cytosol aminopeptidase n=2 Tax=Bombyx TaxID=7090 RepID=Q8T105_BOMMO|nr:leucyl aminopeptidase-like protein [Bombyx mori]XP_028026572.1 cytosol aminopeptidase-like [Bombyx mandarina]BAB85194.1 leucyl aminopeptidase-like protein [Bombyx mori]BAC10615.1 leucyl aminopeptidase-like protein [Bombyx mori]